MASKFVLVRLTKITGVDLNVFEFDYDLNWMAFFINADETIYGRHGGRNARSAEANLSLAGLRYALNQALAAHERAPREPAVNKKKPLLVDDYPAARRLPKGTCIHCHQVWEFRREQMQAEGKWSKDHVWRYPLPENIGLTLNVDQGDQVRDVAPESAANRAGVRVGDVLERLNGFSVASFGDVQYALHRAPEKGEIDLSWKRADKTHTAKLQLTQGWRRTNITWRPSLLDILPSPLFYGDDLDAAQKKALGLGEKRLAFRQDRPIHTNLKAIGLGEEDVILGIDNQALEMTVLEFLAYLRKNYLVGDRIMVNVLRQGKRVNLPMTLR